MINLNYIFCMLLFSMGLYCILTRKNLIKIIIGLSIMDNGLNLLLISLGYRYEGTAPILDNASQAIYAVDPIPQALTLTSIVIGVCVTALALGIAVKVHEHYGSMSSGDVRRLNG